MSKLSKREPKKTIPDEFILFSKRLVNTSFLFKKGESSVTFARSTDPLGPKLVELGISDLKPQVASPQYEPYETNRAASLLQIRH